LDPADLYADYMKDQIRAQAEGNTIHIVISRPRMDAAFLATFKEQVSAAWIDGLTRAVVDMSLVEFVDSSGVGSLLGVLRRLPPSSATVVLKNMRPQVRSVIELLRLQRIFHIEN